MSLKEGEHFNSYIDLEDMIQTMDSDIELIAFEGIQ